MTGMELYVRFVFSVAVGLAALGFVLTTLLETLLNEWDPVRAAEIWWRRLTQARPLHHRRRVSAEEILQELEGRKSGRYEPRPATALDRRREVLRGMREAEERLAAPEALDFR